MDIEYETLTVIEGIVKSKPDGITFLDIWNHKDSKDKTTLTEQSDLSRYLRELSQKQAIIKFGSRYYHKRHCPGGQPPNHVSPDYLPGAKEKQQAISKQRRKTQAWRAEDEEKSAKMTNEIKAFFEKSNIVQEQPVKEVKVVQTQHKRTPVETVKEKIAEKPFGSLQRSSALGGSALALYKCRENAPLSLDDLVGIVGCQSRPTLISALGRLIKAGYVIKDNTNYRYPKFSWSFNYRYPFKEYKPTDKELLKIQPIDFFSKTVPQVEVKTIDPETIKTGTINVPETNEVKKPDASISQSVVIQLIDLQIEALENQINNLKTFRATLNTN